MRAVLCFSALVLSLSGCVSTPYKGLAANSLSDDQLVIELQDVYRQLGISTAGLQSLRASLPPPDPQITARSFTTMNLSTQFYGNTAYTTGTATTTTQYDVTDQNDMARSMNQIAQGIQQGRINALQSRQYEVVAEANRRLSIRREQEAALGNAVRRFYSEHPALRDEAQLLATILPWEQGGSYNETLGRVGFEAESILASRDTKTPFGRWYGVLQVKPAGISPFTIPVRGSIELRELLTSCVIATQQGLLLVLSGMGAETFVGQIATLRPSESLSVGGLGLVLPADVLGTLESRSVRVTFSTRDARGDSAEGLLTLNR